MKLSSRFYLFTLPAVILIFGVLLYYDWQKSRDRVANAIQNTTAANSEMLSLLAANPDFLSYFDDVELGRSEQALIELERIRHLFNRLFEISGKTRQLLRHLILFSKDRVPLLTVGSNLAGTPGLDQTLTPHFAEDYTNPDEVYSKIEGAIHCTILALGRDANGNGRLDQAEVSGYLHAQHFLPIAQITATERAHSILDYLILLACLLLMWVLLVWIGRSVTAPIQALARHAEEVSKGGRNGSFLISEDIVELQTLGESLNRMMASLESNRRQLLASNEELARHMEFRQTLIDAVPVPIFFKNNAGMYLGCNTAFEEVVNLQRDDLIGQTVDEILCDEEFIGLCHFSDLELFAQGGRKSFEATVRYGDGSEHDVIFSKAAFLDTDGKIAGLVGAYLDVSVLKNAERRLLAANRELTGEVGRRNEAEKELLQYQERLEEMVEERTAELSRMHSFYKTVLDSLSEAVAIINVRDWTLVGVNRAFLQEYAMTEKEVLCRTCHDVTHGLSSPCAPPADPCPLLETLETGGHAMKEHLHRNSKGEPVYVEVATNPIMDENGEVVQVVHVARNISERKMYEKSLEESMKRAEQASRAKSEFLANMSHEIRTPMNAVIGMSTLLLTTNLTEVQRDYAETIQQSSDLLLSLINDILDVSKIEAGKLNLEMIGFDLRAALEDVLHLLAVKAHEKGLEFNLLVHADVPVRVKGDPGRLRQILLNLAGNAIKFTVAGEVVITVRKEAESDNHVTLYFKVRDTGIGIPASFKERLFQSFSQVDASTTRKYGGTGLGLAIAKQLAEMMGGELGVESEEGKGSVFWFTAVLEKQAGPEPRQEAIPGNVRGQHILLVDDNATNRKVLAEQLKTIGCRHASAADGQTALHMLNEAAHNNDPFDIAILDMQMPGMSGEELGRRIKSEPQLAGIKLIMITSAGDRGDGGVFADLGFAAYLNKPFKFSLLYDCLATVCGQNGLAPALADQKKKRSLVTRHSLAEQKKDRPPLLLVEDNLFNQKVALGILANLGYKADVAENGRDALIMLAKRNYDLVLMDIQMPEMDGFEATALIRRPDSLVLNHQVPIIAMTAHALAGYRERCLEAGMNDYVSKPIDPQQLFDAIVKQYAAMGQAGSPPVPEEVKEDPPVQEQKAAGGAGVSAGDIQVLDTVGFLNRLGGDEELGRNVLKLFRQDVPHRLELLRQALDSRNAREVRMQAHTIKGATANAGAHNMRALAYEIEMAAKAEALDQAESLLASLKAEFERVKARIDEIPTLDSASLILKKAD